MSEEERRAKLISSPTRYAFRYHERIEALYYNGTIHALTIVLIAQFIFFNLHYVIGGTLTVLALVSVGAQVAISAAEWSYVQRSAVRRLHYTLGVHFWLNRGFLLLYVPFMLWAVVLMYERVHSGV